MQMFPTSASESENPCRCSRHLLRNSKIHADVPNICFGIRKSMQMFPTSASEFENPCRCSRHLLRDPKIHADVPDICFGIRKSMQMFPTSASEFENPCRCSRHLLRNSKIHADLTGPAWIFRMPSQSRQDLPFWRISALKTPEADGKSDRK